MWHHDSVLSYMTLSIKENIPDHIKVYADFTWTQGEWMNDFSRYRGDRFPTRPGYSGQFYLKLCICLS